MTALVFGCDLCVLGLPLDPVHAATHERLMLPDTGQRMKPHSEKRIPLAENERSLMLLARLRVGPASTLDLQKELPLVHVARQIWELRHWYGCRVATSRLPNRIAVYTLLSGPRDDA